MVGKPIEAVASIDTSALDEGLIAVTVTRDDTDTLGDDDSDIIPDSVALTKPESVTMGDTDVVAVISLLIDGAPEVVNNADTELRAIVGVTVSLIDAMDENIDVRDTAFTVTVGNNGVAETHPLVDRDTVSRDDTLGDAVELNIADRLIVRTPDIETIDVREIETDIDGEPDMVIEATID